MPLRRPRTRRLEITPNGIVVRGEIGSVGAPRHTPVVDIAETHQGAAFTAFQSWIPAGCIDRFVWSWVEYSNFSIWSGVEKSITDEHRFILPKPAGLTQISQICLRIEGSPHHARKGTKSAISAGDHLPGARSLSSRSTFHRGGNPSLCRSGGPSWTETIALRDALAGHIGVQRGAPGQEPYSLEHSGVFRGLALGEASGGPEGRAEPKCAPRLMVIVVLPAGTFDSSRREIESRLPSSRERLATPMQFTEDDEGGWTRMFAVAKTPSAYLISARARVRLEARGRAGSGGR